MTEPKHIPLPKRLREYAAAKAEEIRAALEAADDAHDFEEDEDEAAMAIDPTGGPGVEIRPFMPEETAALDAIEENR